MLERGPSVLSRARLPGPPQDLAPVTLFADAGAEGGLASAWSRMPASLGGDAGGLLPPLQCKEVSAGPRRPSRMRTSSVSVQPWVPAQAWPVRGSAMSDAAGSVSRRVRAASLRPTVLPPASSLACDRCQRSSSRALLRPASRLSCRRGADCTDCMTSLMWSSRDVIGWCQSRRARVQVFKLEAGPDVDPAAARRQLQKYMGTFRGRALMGPLPLPPPAAKGAAVKVSAARASSRTGFRLCEHPRCHPVCV